METVEARLNLKQPKELAHSARYRPKVALRTSDFEQVDFVKARIFAGPSCGWVFTIGVRGLG